MGVDTKGKLKGSVRHEDILNFIKQKIDSNAKSYVKSQNYGKIIEDKEDYISESGFIDFITKSGRSRSLFYCHSNQIDKSNYKYYCDRGLEEIVTTETTHISLGYDNESVDIISSIVTEFGGWIDESDCDDEEYRPIVKNQDGSIKPVYVVTMNDIYEKFGGVVIIDKTR